MTDKNSQDLATMSAQPMEVELGGEKYKIARPTLDDFGALQEKIKQDKMGMLATALKATGEDREYITKQMMDIINSPVGNEAYKNALSTPKYLIFIIWRCLVKHSPEITETDVAGKLDNDSLNEIASVLLSTGTKAKNVKRVSQKKAKA